MEPAWLVIADIGGYTRFMNQTRLSLAHAQQLIALLLETVIDTAKPLKLSKLEGDAAFLFAPEPSLEVDALTHLVTRIRERFLLKRQELERDRHCDCEACRRVGGLSLKFVAHRGDVARQKVKSHRELAGIDVILVHRMLKNDVPIREYLLMTEAVHESLSTELRALTSPVELELEGIGSQRGHYLDLQRVPVTFADTEPRRWRGFLRTMVMDLKAVPTLIGLQRPRLRDE